MPASVKRPAAAAIQLSKTSAVACRSGSLVLATSRATVAIGRWYARFTRAGLQIEPHEILVKGPPWNTTVCVHFTDHAAAPDGEVVYTNHGVLFIKIAWGKIRFSTVYEDTQKVAAFDEYLAAVGV